MQITITSTDRYYRVVSSTIEVDTSMKDIAEMFILNGHFPFRATDDFTPGIFIDILSDLLQDDFTWSRS